MASKKLTLEEVRHMARLSRLEVKAEEEALFAAQFGDILSYMDALSRIDVHGVEPLYSPVTHAFAGREDRAEKRRSREDMLANAPRADGTYFIVPRIV